MVKKGFAIWLVLLAVLLSIGSAQPAAAQDYRFGVPELLMQVYVQEDASTRIVYAITFENQGVPIDIVDIGMPHKDYNIGTMRASINGVALTDIRKSEYIDVGVEVHLKDQAIRSGQRGTLHFEFTMPDMVYADTTNEENASLQITPTWFDASSVRGTGTIEIRVYMLPGIQPDEVLYQDVAFSDKVVEDGRVVAVWRYDNVAATKAYRVGVSFPRRGLTRVVEMTNWDLLMRWLGGAVGAVSGLLSCLPFCIPAVFIFFIIRAAAKGSKPQYLPPIAQVEGGGIKRGLTAPEAAVILELPLNKVLTLVIFGLLEKGLIRQVEETPLTVEVSEDFRVAGRPEAKDEGERKKYRRRVAQQQGTIIHAYEDAFLDLIEANPGKAIKDLDVVKAVRGLVQIAADKMQGFDLKETQEYYRRVIARAMEQASALGTVEQREEYLDKYLPWIMLDRQYPTVLTMGGYNYWPRWARTTPAPMAGGAVGGGRAQGSAGSGGRSTTTFGDVAASFAGWSERTMGGMAAAIMPTRLSKPAPPSTYSGGGSGGSSCACACAGCACACACAGGGR